MSFLRLVVDHLWDGAPILAAEQVVITLRAVGDGLVLEVDAPFHGDPAPMGPPGSTDRLWEHEVVELFVAEADPRGALPRYTEIELGPHGHHLVLRLEGVRRPVTRGLALPYRVSLDASASPPRWRGEAHLDRTLLPPAPHRGNAYSIHGVGAARRHLAWAPVPGAQPDFHRLERFRDLLLP